MADIRLAKPAAGTTQTVPSAPDGRFIFDFPADAATLTRSGDNLVLTFEDGASIQLQDFYTTYSKEEMPSFQVEGVEISGQDFFAALGEDLMPAAGPAAGSSASRSGRYNEYGGSDLLDGIDHLGRLDIGFDGGTQLATGTVEPSAPEVDIDYDVTITGGLGADGSELTVYESGLAGGTQAGQEGAPTTATGSLTINAPDGVASIVIGDVVFFANGKLTGNAVSTGEGTLKVTGYDPATGKLDFSYSLDRNTTEHVKSDPATDTQISHDLTVTVTDTDGDSASTTITVNVVDDAPTIGAPGEASMEVDESGEASHQAKVDINDFLTVDAGADGEAGRTYKLTLGEGAGENLQAIVDGQVYDIELTLNEEGNRISGTAEGEEIFYVSVDEKGEVYLSLTGNGSLKHPDSTSADEGLKLEDIGVQVTVTDGDGDEKSVDVNLDLTIKDDGPTVTVTQGNDAQYGQEVKIGTLDSDYGADGENTLEALQLQIDGKIGVLSNGVYTFAGIGSVRIGEDGQIFFTPLADSGADRDYTLQVTVTDGDDDKDTDSISFRVEGTDLAGVKGSVTGDDANVLTKQTVDVEIPTEQLEALGATLVPNQEVPVMDAQDDVYGKLYVNEDGKVTFVQTKAYTGHMEPDQPDELADGFSGKLKVTLADGTPSSITVDVSIRDDAPVEPGKIDFMTLDGAGNYDDNSLVILFTIGATPGNTKLEDLKFGADVGGEDAPAMLTVKVNGMEFSIEVTRDEDGQLHFSGDDDDTITFTGPEDTGKYGSLSYDKGTGIFTYTRPEGDIGGEKNSYDISLTITDADGDAVTVSEDYETVFREPTVIGDTVTTDEGNIIMGGALIGSEGETEVTAPVRNTAQGSITVNLDHADGTIVIESPSSKSITITIDKNGDIVEIGNEVIRGKHGYISDVHVSSVTPDGTIKIDYTYTLNTPVDGGNRDNGRGDSHLADEFTVTVTTDGGSATGTITANALDDAPVLEVTQPEGLVKDTAETIKIPLEKFSVGADYFSLDSPESVASISVKVGEKYYTFTVGGYNGDGKYEFIPSEGQDKDLIIISTADGGYKIVYTRAHQDIADGKGDNYMFDITVTDADGDTTTGSVTVTTIPPTIDEGSKTDLQVDEGGLVHDSNSKTGAGQLVVDMHGQAGTVTIGGATVTVGADDSVSVVDDKSVPGEYGVLTITNAQLGSDGQLTIDYTYELQKRYEHLDNGTPTNRADDADSFAISINGANTGQSVTVDIIDDEPQVTVKEGVSASLELTESTKTALQTFNASALFDIKVGADTEGSSTKYELTYREDANSGLKAIVDGEEYNVTLQLEGGILKGTAGGRNIFTVSVAEDTGTVTLEMTGQGTLRHDKTAADDELHLKGVGVKVTVTDGDDDTASKNVELDLTIKDDEPSIEVVDGPVSSVKPENPDSQNLKHTNEDISFINYKQVVDENGNPVKDENGNIKYEEINSSLKTEFWDEQVKIYGVKVDYQLSGENVVMEGDHPVIDKCIQNKNFTLQYSPYNGGTSQNLPNGGTRPAPESDWGLMVTSKNQIEGSKSYHDQELSVSPDGRSSAGLVIDLQGNLAYGFRIDFGAFYTGNDGPTDNRWDGASEKALLTFYRDGKIVHTELVTSDTEEGDFTFNRDEFIANGFDQVIVSAVDNKSDPNSKENSDFVIKGFDFVTKGDDPIIVNEGSVKAEPGADGFADSDVPIRFDFEAMGIEMAENGKSGTITLIINGVETPVTVNVAEGSEGSILTGTTDTGDVFTVTLDKDDNWTMEQYQQFRVPEGRTYTNKFELVFKTEDADGDTDSITVDVPLEVTMQLPADNNNEANEFRISGDAGIAGTILAGDLGGRTEEKLADMGQDTITAAESASSGIIYGDALNTDLLLADLMENDAIKKALETDKITFGSGAAVFAWLEQNAILLNGTEFEGWDHSRTIDYALRHYKELGYETRLEGGGTIYLVDADGNVWNTDGTKVENVSLDNLTGREGGDDTIIGSRADDIFFGQEGDDTIFGGAGDDSLYGGTGDDLLVGDDKPENLAADTVADIKTLGTSEDLDAFIQSVEGTDADGDDRLFGGMGGDDYIDGGAGEDAIFGGRGNDIIVYDNNDYLVSGGSGIDFMVSDDSNLTLETLLKGGTDDNEGPIVNSIEVLLKGNDALSLTSIQELADKYGITLGTNPDGQETLTLDMSKWTENDSSTDDTHVFTSKDSQLTLETNLQHDSDASSDNGEMAQQVFILEHTNS